MASPAHSAPRPPPTSLQLDLFPYDILLQICHAVKRLKVEENHPEHLVKPLKRFSLVNKSIREICIPLLLSHICLAEANGGRMNWIPSFRKIMRRDNGCGAGRYVRAFDLRIDSGYSKTPDKDRTTCWRRAWRECSKRYGDWSS